MAPLDRSGKATRQLECGNSAGGARLAVNPNIFYFKILLPLFVSPHKGIPMSWKEMPRHQTKYIHQLSTPYPISGTLFGFEIGWREQKLRDKALGPKRGP
jgi:hypothetical protein